jgi:hypothetical protein
LLQKSRDILNDELFFDFSINLGKVSFINKSLNGKLTQGVCFKTNLLKNRDLAQKQRHQGADSWSSR